MNSNLAWLWNILWKGKRNRCSVALSTQFCGVNLKDLYSDVRCNMKAHLGTHFVSSAFDLLFFLVSYKRVLYMWHDLVNSFCADWTFYDWMKTALWVYPRAVMSQFMWKTLQVSGQKLSFCWVRARGVQVIFCTVVLSLANGCTVNRMAGSNLLASQRL